MQTNQPLATVAKPPTIRFAEPVHAMTTATSCDSALLGLDHLIKNLKRCTVPAEHQEQWDLIAQQLAEGIQLVRNIKILCAESTEAQIREGKL